MPVHATLGLGEPEIPDRPSATKPHAQASAECPSGLGRQDASRVAIRHVRDATSMTHTPVSSVRVHDLASRSRSPPSHALSRGPMTEHCVAPHPTHPLQYAHFRALTSPLFHIPIRSLTGIGFSGLDERVESWLFVRGLGGRSGDRSCWGCPFGATGNARPDDDLLYARLEGASACLTAGLLLVLLV